MSLSDENALLKMVIETQAARLHEQEATIQELRQMVAELRSLKVNLEENLEELRRQIFGIKSEKTSHDEDLLPKRRKRLLSRNIPENVSQKNEWNTDSPS